MDQKRFFTCKNGTNDHEHPRSSPLVPCSLKRGQTRRRGENIAKQFKLDIFGDNLSVAAAARAGPASERIKFRQTVRAYE